MSFKAFNPLVSVIIPVYNGESYIEECINSVLSQDYSSLEIIVVDDGSKDKTFNILNKYKKIITVIKQNNQGVSKARNVAISISRGEFVTFIDADDFMLDGKISNQVQYMLSDDKCDLCYTDYSLFDSNKTIYKSMRDNPYIDIENIEIGDIFDKIVNINNPICLSTVMCRRILFDRIGMFDEKLNTFEDRFFFAVASTYAKLHYLNEVLIRKRLHCGNLSKNFGDINKTGTILGLTKLKIMFPGKIKTINNALGNTYFEGSKKVLFNAEYYNSIRLLFMSNVVDRDIKKNIKRVLIIFKILLKNIILQ